MHFLSLTHTHTHNRHPLIKGQRYSPVAWQSPPRSSWSAGTHNSGNTQTSRGRPPASSPQSAASPENTEYHIIIEIYPAEDSFF